MSVAAAPEGEPQAPEWESLFTFTTADLSEIQQELLTVNLTDMRSYVDANRDGAADAPMTAMHDARLDLMHAEAGRFSADPVLREGEALQYAIGQLYGGRIAETQFYRQTGRPLTMHDLKAFNTGIFAATDSYNRPPVAEAVAEGREPWYVESVRERVVTGGTYISILNATLSQHFLGQIQALYAEQGLKMPPDDIKDMVPFLRGMVDSLTFLNSYARMQEQGLPPQSFELMIGSDMEDLKERYKWRFPLNRKDYLRRGPVAPAADIDELITRMSGDKQVVRRLAFDQAVGARVLSFMPDVMLTGEGRASGYYRIVDNESIAEAIAPKSAKDLILNTAYHAANIGNWWWYGSLTGLGVISYLTDADDEEAFNNFAFESQLWVSAAALGAIAVARLAAGWHVRRQRQMGGEPADE